MLPLQERRCEESAAEVEANGGEAGGAGDPASG